MIFESRPNEILYIYQEFWRAPQNLLPGQELAQQLSQAARNVVAAQPSRAQAAMSLNTKLIEVWMNRTEAAAPMHVAEDAKAQRQVA